MKLVGGFFLVMTTGVLAGVMLIDTSPSPELIEQRKGNQL
jgi:hypothetical protein